MKANDLFRRNNIFSEQNILGWAEEFFLFTQGGFAYPSLREGLLVVSFWIYPNVPYRLAEK